MGMAGSRDDTSSQALLDQQRVLAEFGEAALNAEDLSGILNEACRLVGEALRTDLAKVVELLPDGKSMLVRAGVGWRPGVVNEVVISADEGSPEGLTLKDGAVISPDINREERFSYHEFLRDHGSRRS
jgi:GAF domain-containing protein